MVLTMSSGSGVGYIRKDRYFFHCQIEKKKKLMCLDFLAPLPLFSVLLGTSVSVSVCAAEEVRERSKEAASGGFWQQLCMVNGIVKEVSGHHKVQPYLHKAPNLTRKS